MNGNGQHCERCGTLGRVPRCVPCEGEHKRQTDAALKAFRERAKVRREAEGRRVPGTWEYAGRSW